MVQFENAVKFFNKVILTELNRKAYCFVAGGCVRDYFSIARISSDIDIYFTSEIDFKVVKDYLLNHTLETYVEDGNTISNPKEKATLIFENNNATRIKYKGRIYDLVSSLYEQPKECISKFDFTVSCAAVDPKQVYVHDAFFIDLSKRQLMINALPFPLSTMWRTQKYIKKGYTICKGETLKLAKAISKLNLNEEGENVAVEILDSNMSEDSLNFIGFD